MATPRRSTYRREAAVLKRLLEPHQNGTGIICGWEQPESGELTYLGEADVFLSTYSMRVTDLTSDPDWQEHLRHAAILAGCYDDHYDEIEPSGDFTLCVEYPFDKMHPLTQAQHQLRTLLVNNYAYGDGEGHEWALDMGRSIVGDLWYKPLSRRYHWELSSDCWNADEDMQTLQRLLLAIGVDLEPHCVGNMSVDQREVPRTPPLGWVRRNKITRKIFPKLPPGTYQSDIDELDLVIAFCIQGLVDDQKASWDNLLYLNDVFCSCDRDTVQRELATRVYALPELTDIAVSIRSANDIAAVNAALRRLYDEAPARGVWVIA